MASAFNDHRHFSGIAGTCDCEGARVRVAISNLKADGCLLEADSDWQGESDFAHLRIAETIDMNGKLAWAKGRRAQMRFFGQVHPAAIAKLMETVTL